MSQRAVHLCSQAERMRQLQSLMIFFFSPAPSLAWSSLCLGLFVSVLLSTCRILLRVEEQAGCSSPLSSLEYAAKTAVRASVLRSFEFPGLSHW